MNESNEASAVIGAAEFSAIFNKPNPTPADYAALKARVLATSFEHLAPDAKLS